MSELTSTNVDHYKTVLGHFCTGVTVVTSRDEGRPVGFTCQAFSALSLRPPMILLCPAKTSSTWPRIRRSGAFAVNVLGMAQRELGARFGRTGIDRFAGVPHRPSPSGMPLLDGAIAWLECRIDNEVEGGDHTIVTASVTALGLGAADRPLLYFQGRFIDYDVKEAVTA